MFLDVATAEVMDRLRARSGHVMPPTPMDSQFATLERPGPEEADVLTVAAGCPVHDIVDEIACGLAVRANSGAEQHG